MLNSKSEILNSKQIINSNFSNSKQMFGTFEFKICDLFRVSYLEFRISAIILLLFCSSISSAAQDISFDATVDRNVVALGERVQLSLTFQGATDAPAPAIQELDGFSARYLGPSSMMSIINGKVSSSISHKYILIPLKTGKFTIGPFFAEYDNQKYTSRAIDIEVIDQPTPSAPGVIGNTSSARQPPAAIAEEQLKDRIFVELDAGPPSGAGKKDIYLNEIIPVTARIYINKLAIKDIEYPVISMEGFSKEQFAKPDQYQKTLSGLIYDVIEFRASAYPLKTGVLNIGPAEVKCNLITRRQRDDFFGDFFNTYESYPLDLKSSSIDINVKPLPEENKPADFSGAVGDFDMQVEIDQSSVKAGDPVTLKAKISGEGNFATVNAPTLEDVKDFKVYQPQVLMHGNEKIFEQVVIPLSESVAQMPGVSFSFFNPRTQSYQTIKKGPFAISVLKPSEKEQLMSPVLVDAKIVQSGAQQMLIPQKEEIFGKDIAYIKENPGTLVKRSGFLYQSRFFVWIFILPLIAFIVLYFMEMKNKRLRTDIRYARLRGAYKKAQKGISKAQNYLKQQKKDEFYAAIFKTLQDYIGDKLHIPSGGITAESARQHLAEKEVSGEALDKIREFFDACDAARFAQSSVAMEDTSKVLILATEIIEALERVRV